MPLSSAMLHAKSFGRSLAYVSLVAHGLSLLDYVRQAVTSSAVVALLVVLPNALLRVMWYALVGRRLNELGRLGTVTSARGSR